MENRVVAFIKDFMLPIALVSGISLYLLYHFITPIHVAGPMLHKVAVEAQRTLVALMLFLQFVKISPHDLKFTKWHLKAILFQAISFVAVALIAVYTEDAGIKILLECAMLCLICPTASAAGVITEKLGGNLAQTVTYVVMINVLATFLIPAIIPLVKPSSDLPFWTYVWKIGLRIFPVLILPSILAWTFRYTTHKFQRWLMRHAHWSFYIWGICLTLAMALSTRALLLSGLSAGIIACIVMVSMGCCAIQFIFGRKSSKDHITKVTAGQALGQKNTGFLIWLGYSYMTPVTSVAGGLYAIWQNLFNSWELYEKNHNKNGQ